MSESQSPLDDLRAFRELLVAERRRIIRAALELREANEEQSPTSGAGHGAELQRIQEQIEAVDRAFEDEKKIALEEERGKARAPSRPYPPRPPRGVV